jgi:hypothetical protein
MTSPISFTRRENKALATVIQPFNQTLEALACKDMDYNAMFSEAVTILATDPPRRDALQAAYAELSSKPGSHLTLIGTGVKLDHDKSNGIHDFLQDPSEAVS